MEGFMLAGKEFRTMKKIEGHRTDNNEKIYINAGSVVNFQEFTADNRIKISVKLPNPLLTFVVAYCSAGDLTSL